MPPGEKRVQEFEERMKASASVEGAPATGTFNWFAGSYDSTFTAFANSRLCTAGGVGGGILMPSGVAARRALG
jgi:hypothetical protein